MAVSHQLSVKGALMPLTYFLADYRIYAMRNELRDYEPQGKLKICGILQSANFMIT